MLKLPSSWQQHLSFNQIMQLQGEVFRLQDNRKTLRFRFLDQYYFAKLHWGVGWREIFKNILQGRLPIISAKNEWLAIQRLQQLNISTTPLVGYGARGWNPSKHQSFVITEELKEMVSLEDLCRDWKEKPPSIQFKRELIAKVAHVAKKLHNNGLNHRDFYICHFLLDKLSLKNLHLIDLHRVQIRRHTPLRWQIKDIGGLYFSAMDIGLTERDILYFIKCYSSVTLRETLKQKKIWRRAKQRAIKLYAKTFFKRQQTWNQLTVYDNRYSLCPLLDTIDQTLEKGILLKQDATTTVSIVDINHRQFVVKRYNIKNIFHRFKRYFTSSRAQKCWNAAQQLLQNGLPTAQPVAFIEKRFGPFRKTSYYIYEYRDALHLLDYCKQFNPEDMTHKITLILKKLARHAISHGDMKATNILIYQQQPFLIDLDAMRIHQYRYFFKKAHQKDLWRFMKNWETMPNIKQLFITNFKEMGYGM